MYSAAIALLANFVKYKNFDQFSQNFCNRIIDRKIRLTDLTYWSTAKIRTPDISYHCENFFIQNKIDQSPIDQEFKTNKNEHFLFKSPPGKTVATTTLKWQTSVRNYGTVSATKTQNSPPGSKPLLLVARKPSSAVSSPPPLFSSLPLV